MAKKFIDVKISGNKEIDREFEKLKRNIKEATKPREIPVAQVVNDNFVKKHTQSSSFMDFVVGSGLISEEEEITEDILNSPEFNEYVKNNTSFNSWKHMLDVAAKEYFEKQLGF